MVLRPPELAVYVRLSLYTAIGPRFFYNLHIDTFRPDWHRCYIKHQESMNATLHNYSIKQIFANKSEIEICGKTRDVHIKNRASIQ